MQRTQRSVRLLLAALLLVAFMAPTAFAARPLMPNHMGAAAYTYIKDLIVAPRAAATPGEVAAAKKVASWFKNAGYSVEIQRFTYTWDGTTYHSQNVVARRPARKKPKGVPTPQVIVGAHYDAVTAGQGADDNASGVAVMVEVAQRIAKYKQEYDITFIGFGAEEAGLRGSAYYVSRMTQAEKARTIAMLNFDSLIVGDKLYIHAGFNEKTWARDAMLRLIRLHKLPIGIQPGLNPAYPAGLTPDGFSDYTAFNDAGIPIAAFESTNWEIGELDGYEQTAEYGSFWHTPNDNLRIIERLLPGRPMVRLKAYTTLVFEFLKHLNPASVR